MKKTLLATGMMLALGTTGSANAVFTPIADGAYTLSITGGCFEFGNCQTSGNGVLTDNSTANQASVAGFGSGIVGDGLMGVLGITVTGGNLSVTSYSQDSYLATAGGTFYLQDQDQNGSAMGGNIDAVGNMTLDLTGRDGIAASFASTLGLQPWNIDNPSTGTGTGLYDMHTTGTSTNDPKGLSGAFSLTGTPLSDAGAGVWTGTLVVAGNIGTAWGSFDNTQYSELYNVSISAVPVPAAVWLFGSGLVGLAGVARRRNKLT